jgi:poly(A) polymerase
MELGLIPKDFDFATSARPETTKSILTAVGLPWFPIGERFGTIATRMADGFQVEITTYRRDLTEGRCPEVVFSDSLEEDLGRRDFRMNSMARGENGTLVDPFDGKSDIENKIIRTTGSPSTRFGEDPLRMLRAVRFASQLGFSVHRQTREAIRSFAQAIMIVSRERWLVELNKLLLGDGVEDALDLLHQTRLLGYVLPEAFVLTMQEASRLPSKNLWQHTKRVVSQSARIPEVRWAALLHDVAKPQTRVEVKGDVHFFQHEQLGAEMVESVARRLKMSNDFRESVKGLVSLHQRVGDIVSRRNDPPVSGNALRRLIRDCEENNCLIEHLIELFAADCSSSRKETQERQGAHAALLRTALATMREEDLRPKLPKGVGEAIMARFGLQPGPEVGRLKGILDGMLLDGHISAEDSIDSMLDTLIGEVRDGKHGLS